MADNSPLIDTRPLLVRVWSDGWEPLPADDKGWSVRERWLIDEMVQKGGVNPYAVKPGYYHMNILEKKGVSFINFTPVPFN